MQHWQCWLERLKGSLQRGQKVPVMLISLLASLFGGKRPWIMSWELTVVILQVSPRKAPAHPVEVEEDVNNGTHQLLQLRQFPQLPEGSCGSPVFSIRLPLLMFRSCSFSPQLSCRSNCSLYMYLFEFAHGRGWVQHPLMPPPFWTSPRVIF